MNNASTSPPIIRVLCVDDLVDVTAALRMIIGTDPSMLCVGCLSSANDLVAEILGRQPRPDVVIVDASMPGRDPLSAIAELATRCPETSAIVFSGHDDEAFIDRATRAGAWSCVSKSSDPKAILQAVREVVARGPRAAPL
ncbi:MAG TPA: response regulator transcription factor [Phycisphaerales bacterium]